MRASPEDFAALVDATARHLGYPQAFVERDYWITEVLRSLSKPLPQDGMVIFKGGTSLSKGWELIERMSEDVDAIVVLPEGSSKGAYERALKTLTQRVPDDTGLAAGESNAEKGVHRRTELPYDQKHGHAALTGSRVLLELGTRGGPEPHGARAFKSYMATVAIGHLGASESEFFEFAAVEIPTLAPERTLLEKLSALHHLASVAIADPGEFQRIGTKMRHLYDVAVLLRSQTICRALEMADIHAMVDDIGARSGDAGWGWTPRPPGGYAEIPAFADAFLQHPDVVAAYGRTLDLVFGSVRPSLADGHSRSLRWARNRARRRRGGRTSAAAVRPGTARGHQRAVKPVSAIVYVCACASYEIT